MPSSRGLHGNSPGCRTAIAIITSLRDVAKPVRDADSHAKVQMRKKVRGLRGIEQSILKQRRRIAQEGSQTLPQPSIVIEAAHPDNPPRAEEEPAGDVVLAYCAAVRGILNDDQGDRFIRLACG